MPAVVVRPTENADEFRHAIGSIGHYFGGWPDEESAERFGRLLPLERTHAAFDGDRVVGGAGAFPFTMTVPGGEVGCAGVTVVGVLPTHRRRGVLTALMRAQLDDVRDRGEPIAALWASEEPIYGRFGYGLASLSGEVTLAATHAQLVDGPSADGTVVRLLDAEEARERLPAVYERVRSETPGMYARSPEWWELRQTFDSPEQRRGAGHRNYALLELDGRDAGYALYRLRSAWEAGVSTGSIEIGEAIADSPLATRELWRFLLSLDWVATVSAFLVPVDHPLWHLLVYPRRMQFRVGDGLWVRLVDVEAALAARSYTGDGAVTLELADDFCPWNAGTWTVSAEGVERDGGEPDLRLDVQALAAVYLGGFTFAELARGLRLEEARAGGVARADALFATGVKPWCPEIF
jgi:predicted acetyltransferase